METRPRPSPLPVQAPPVGSRAGAWQYAGRDTGPGVAAAGNACQDLTGLAQQMCYSAIYGI